MATDSFTPYVERLDPDLENRLHQELRARFAALEPEKRPWYGAGVALQTGTASAGRVSFLIVPPTHIVLAHVFHVPGVASGILHGNPAAKEWWVETTDRRVEKIGALSPFEQAKGALHLFLPKLDAFLHSRKIKNPYVQSILVFPDEYSFAGVQDVPVGAAARGAITAVKFSEVVPATLSNPREENLDRSVFAEWLQTFLPRDVQATFEYTWLEPHPRPAATSSTAAASSSTLSFDSAAVENTPRDVITLTQEAEWSFDDPNDSGPTEFKSEELRLPERAAAAADERERRRSLVLNRVLKAGAGLVLGVLVLFIAHELYMYLTPNFPSSPYWDGQSQESQPAADVQPDEPQSPPDQAAASHTQASVEAGSAETATAPVAAPPEPPALPVTASPSSSPAAAAIRSDPPSLASPGPITPAISGTYETIRPTLALEQPRDSATVVDRLRSGTRLNVTGSDGNWLIVRSRTRNGTVYVRRDDAMLTSDAATRPQANEKLELQWKEVELQIREAILKRGVPNITVSFIGDTAYLKGNVRTRDDSYNAELAARTIPDVKYVHNGIWVTP